MDVHILNGDALAGYFPFEGEKIICRECLIDGPLYGRLPDDFFEIRAAYISDSFHVPAEDYFRNLKSEFDRLENIPHALSINVWFEHDLFCQANLWFMLCSNIFRFTVWHQR
jgi:hypothetical protein